MKSTLVGKAPNEVRGKYAETTDFIRTIVSEYPFRRTL